MIFILDNNPWVCDCRLNWLILWLQSTTKVRRSASSSKLPTCMEPFQYQGQRLTSIRPLKCSSNYVLQSRVFNISNMTLLNPQKSFDINPFAIQGKFTESNYFTEKSMKKLKKLMGTNWGHGFLKTYYIKNKGWLLFGLWNAQVIMFYKFI